MQLADILEEHKEELATLESIDSGAVYTLALKVRLFILILISFLNIFFQTHIGMSIDTFRYFAGWCDKIQVIFKFLIDPVIV